jgi:GINS complex subunit 4
MDIDDLLAEVAVDSTPRETRDLQELTRCWVAERVAPEILPWPSDLMDRVLDRIRRQVSCHLFLVYRQRQSDNEWC